MSFLKEFSAHKCLLGEGVVWSPKLQCLFWLDITEKCIFQKHMSSMNVNFDRHWRVEFIPTALILLEDEEQILIVADIGLIRLNIGKGSFSSLVEFDLPEGYRTNDAGVGPNNTLWVGIMEKEPTGLNGTVLVVFPDGKITKLAFPVGIPNTFVLHSSSKKMYISDSFISKMYSLDISIIGHDISFSLNEFFSIESLGITPDGGCFSDEGFLLTSLWNGECVGVYDRNGRKVTELSLSVLRPTNCCIGGKTNRTLYITSASLGLNKDQLFKSPLSGSVLSLELDKTISMSTPLYWMPEC